MADRIVINTGPLVALARADVLDIVGLLPFKFVSPAEVRQELDAGARAGHLDARPAWVELVPLTAPLNALGLLSLDRGEAAVIQLAIEQAIRIVCLDDRKGRRAAMAAGLGVTGSLGLLVRAKTLGLLPALRSGPGKGAQRRRVVRLRTRSPRLGGGRRMMTSPRIPLDLS